MKTRFILALSLLTAAQLYAAESLEITTATVKELPGGKEADGIMGDFLLRSDAVEAVISHNAPNRRANMSTFYGPEGVSPGCLYDLTIKGEHNDQLVCYSPAGHGPVSYVKLVPTKEPGSAAVESVTTAAKGGGIFKRDEYRVRDGVQGIFITTVLRNESTKAQKVGVKGDFTRFEKTGEVEGGIFYADAVDPADKLGYAKVTLTVTGGTVKGEVIELAPGAEAVLQRFIAVGKSPADAVGLALEVKGEALGTLSATLTEKGGKLAPSAALLIPYGKNLLPAYPDAKGKISIKLKPGTHAVATADMGRESVTQTIEVKANAEVKQAYAVAAASQVNFVITDEKGVSIPCKAMFKPADEKLKLDLGPKMRAHGCVDQYHSEKGSFSVQLPAGSYTVRVVHGGEYSSIEKQVTLAAGAAVEIKGQLKRVVDSTGWISSDFHNHSTQSGDNICGTDDRLINIAAEQLEFCPTTEHNRLYDWVPHIEKLGLSAFIKTVPGIELTGRRQHINSFPFKPEPRTQDNGAPEWNDDPRVTALTLRRHQGEEATRWIQFNHPDLRNMFIDRNSDGVADGGFVGVGDMIDGTETQNGEETLILASAPFTVNRAPGSIAAKINPVREFIWRQLLNQGLRITAVGVADAHTVYGNGVGGWHIYLPSSTDDPQALQWEEISAHARAGHVLVTNGPFMTVTTPDGKIAGDDSRGTGGTTLHVKVQSTDWTGIDRVQVLVNSRALPQYNYTRATHPQMFQEGTVQFEQKLKIALQQDAHLIVVAMGEGTTLAGGYGTSDQSKMKPCAYNNPIYVDVDGGGFHPNGDTLGFDLPAVSGDVDAAKAALQRAGL